MIENLEHLYYLEDLDMIKSKKNAKEELDKK